MNDALFQSILGHSLIVGFFALIIALVAWCLAIVCEIEGWPKSIVFFSNIMGGAITIGVIAFIVLVAIGGYMMFNNLYCNIVCAS